MKVIWPLLECGPVEFPLCLVSTTSSKWQTKGSRLGATTRSNQAAPAAACPRPGQDSRVRDLPTGSSESGSTFRRAEEVHRTTPTEAALELGHGSEPEIAGAIPQRCANPAGGN